MDRVIADEALRRTFFDFARLVEVCDESGKVVARVVPLLDESQYEPVEPQISEEELERRRHSDEPSYTTAEVLAYLEKL